MVAAPIYTEAVRRQAVKHAAVSVLLVLMLFCVAVQLLPGSTAQRDTVKFLRPLLSGAGLDQGWGVFAPDPRPQTISMRARVTYQDGRTEWWDLPEGDSVIGGYWDFRWRKYLEFIVNDQYRRQLFRPLAVWIARKHHQGGRRPAKVVFVARWHDLYTPAGDGPLRSAWRESAYYTLHVDDDVLAGSR